MLDINTSYFLLGGQGLLCFLLTLYFWLSNPKLAGSKELLGYGLCLSLESFSYSILSPVNITLAATVSNIIAFTTLLFLKISLVKLLKIKGSYSVFGVLYVIGLLLSLIYYQLSMSSQVRIASLSIVLSAIYLLLIYMLNKGCQLKYPKQILFINLCLVINLIGNMTFSWVELVAIRNSPLFTTNMEIILIAVMISASIAIVVGFITIVAEHREHSLIALSKSKSDFITNVSHEVRTPMNGVLGMLSLLDDTPLTDEQKHKIAIAKSSAYSLLAIINEVLDFSKIESGKLELDIVTLDIKKLLEDTTETFALQCHQKNIELVIDSAALTDQSVETDPSKVTQIITNLLSNAVKFTEKGEITISAKLEETTPDNLTFGATITDTGIGIAPEKIQRLFDSYTQADSSTTRKYGGTGLGLCITKKLCELMDGTIQATSIPGQGSSFSFSIKMKKSKQTALMIRQPDLSNKRILIADQHPRSARILHQQLSTLGADTQITTTEQETINSLKHQNEAGFDLVFVSEKLFARDLDDFMANISRIDKMSQVKFVLMAYLDFPHDKNAILLAGFKQMIYKPVLSYALNSVLDKVNCQLEPVLNHHIAVEPISKQPSYDKLAGKTVLVVEDNRINQMVALGLLKQLKAKILLANNGIEALKILNRKNTQVDLILMDCLMPEMDGYQTSQMIRNGKAGEQNSDIIIIALTANAMTNDKSKCIDAGMNDVITKPVNAQSLIATLDLWLTSAEKQLSSNSIAD